MRIAELFGWIGVVAVLTAASIAPVAKLREARCRQVCTNALRQNLPMYEEADDQPRAAANLPGIIFVAAPMFDEQTDGGDGVYQGSYHWRDGYVYARSATYHRAERTMGPVRPGKNLYSLIPATEHGQLKQLTFLKTGAVFKPEPSYDGKRVLFSMRRDGEDWFHLYEMNVDGSNLRPLTDGPFNDFAGVYLPDGRIVFVSDRTGFLEEYHEERTECLFVMNGDGTGMHQITFAPGTYFEPAVLQDGRILFSFWDAFHIDVPPLDKHETYLMTVNPDGTEERHLFGAGQHLFFGRYRHGGIGFTQAKELPDGRIVCQSELGPSIVDPSCGTDARDALTPIFPGCTSIQLGGTTHLVHLSSLGTRSTPYPLPDGRVLFSATPPGARDSAIHVVDPDTREEKRLFNIPNYAEFDAVPVLLERAKPRRLPDKIKDPRTYAGGLSPSPPLGERGWGEGVQPHSPARAPTPPAPHPPGGEGGDTTTRFLVVAGRETDNAARSEALKRARYFRVIEAEYTGVTTSSHTNLETRILGVAPIFPDGSCYFEAPADTPIFLDALDAAGNRVLHEWTYPNTSVPQKSLYPVTQLGYMVGRAGETRSCYGCHAAQNNAVPNTTVEALKHPPVRVTRESTDLQYRRNDPHAYRRQARIGDVGKHRDWLLSKDPVLRARGCEMLQQTDDLSERDFEAVAKLMNDDSVDVRRAAAFCLSKHSNLRYPPEMQAAAKGERDWLARFHIESAAGFEGERIGRLVRVRPKFRADVREDLRQTFWTDKRTLLSAIRTLGRLKDADAVPLLIPWLQKAEARAMARSHEWEYHAAEAAVALGRIGTPEAIEALWAALRSEVPNKQVVYARYLQHGPRPEEYAILEGLALAGVTTKLEDVHLLIALLPSTFMEKPRFEDRMREETQRVRLPRHILQHGGLRRSIVQILLHRLGVGPDPKEPELEAQVLKGINLERPFSEHGRPFPVVKEIGPEEALWLLTCLAQPGEVSEEAIIPFLTSKNHRERIDAAVLLALQGFGAKGSEALEADVAKPYAFPEIWSIGKGMPDENFRDKAYMVMALAMHVDDVNKLKPFADPKAMYRDIRYGLTRGLARRAKPDGIRLLIEMATSDPLTLIRQQARYGVADIQDVLRLGGQAVPEVRWPEPKPLESLYYPPRPLERKDRTPDPLPRLQPGVAGVLDWQAEIKKVLTPANFRNLNMAQARGAERMMIRQVAESAFAFEGLRAGKEAGQAALLGALDSPYPYAQHLALVALAESNHREAIPALVAKLVAQLDAYAKAGNTVGFWWCCEALGKLRAKEAAPALARYAVPINPQNVAGPPGMGLGYAASRALGRITADARHAEVARLLASDNAWLRAGTLRGLADAKAPGIDTLLQVAAAPENPALVRHEASVQLRGVEKK